MLYLNSRVWEDACLKVSDLLDLDFMKDPNNSFFFFFFTENYIKLNYENNNHNIIMDSMVKALSGFLSFNFNIQKDLDVFEKIIIDVDKNAQNYSCGLNLTGKV